MYAFSRQTNFPEYSDTWCRAFLSHSNPSWLYFKTQFLLSRNRILISHMQAHLAEITLFLIQKWEKKYLSRLFFLQAECNKLHSLLRSVLCNPCWPTAEKRIPQNTEMMLKIWMAQNQESLNFSASSYCYYSLIAKN